MHSSDWSRHLTERQREVLTLVVENKVYRNRDSKISDLAAQMGIAPAAVAKHLLEIEKEALLQVVVTPSEQGKRVYERLELEPRPAKRQTSEALDSQKVAILRFLRDHPDASANEVAEELGLSDYTTVNALRVLTAVRLITKQRGPAVRRGVPPYVYRTTAHGEGLAGQLPGADALREAPPNPSGAGATA
jgi:predicted ArsR family transcriptional regulator